MDKVTTLCPYCGVGCSIILRVENGKVTGAEPDKDDPVSEGKPCIKGLNCYQPIYAEDRLKQPMIRKNGKNSPLEQASWEEAYRFIYEKTKGLKPEDIAFYGSSPSSNEDNYLLQKFAREIFRTDNIDSCARLCHATTCYAFYRSYGMSAMPAKIDDFKDADCILIIGSHPSATYPVAFTQKIMAAKRNGAKLIYVYDWENDMTKYADIYAQIAEGSDCIFLCGLLNLLIEKGLQKGAQAAHIPEEVLESIEGYTPESVSIAAKISAAVLNKIADCISSSKKFVLGYGMDLTQHAYGTQNVFAANNLVLAKKGKIISMRGKANIQGVADAGCLPKKGGKTFINAMFFEKVKAIYVMESNPAVSLPDLNTAHKNLKDMFVIIQNTYPNLTAEFADAVLPCCSWAERDGTFTNAESRIRYYAKAVEPLHSTKPNWQIIKELANTFGAKWDYNNAFEIMDEMKKTVPGYDVMDTGKFRDHDSDIFVDRKPTRHDFVPINFSGYEERSSKEYPYLLTTKRMAYNFCTNEMSARSATLNKLSPEPYATISLEDASMLGIKDNDKIRIRSKAGEIETTAKVSDYVPKGLVWVPFHFDKVLINKIVPLEINPEVEEPNLKRIAVNMEKSA